MKLSALGAFILITGFLHSASALVINEFMGANNASVQDPQGHFDDWVELYNESSKTVDLGGLYLTDDLKKPTRWQIPAGILLGKRQFLVIWLDHEQGGAGLHTGFSLQSSGETLALFDRDGEILIDSVAFPEQLTDVSYGRYGDGAAGWFYMPTPTPGSKNRSGAPGRVSPLRVTPARGFYQEALAVTLQTDTPGAEIWYTLDGTWPQVGSHGQRYQSPLWFDQTTVLHAVAGKSGWQDSARVSHTYLFLAQIVRQSARPAGFPTQWGKNLVDYAMDARVVNDPAYAPILVDALKAIPSVCVSLPNPDLFDAKNGIYANAKQRGVMWERMSAMEWIDPVTLRHFDTHAGLRTHGGAGRTASVAKHALRLIFKNEYGPGQLRQPLFDDTEVNSFNSLVLRAGWNYSWIGHSGMSGPKHAQYLRDCFARDTVRDLAGLTPHGRHVHLYLNGLYWGLYVLCERPDDAFAAAHGGGEAQDYDVLKAGHGTGQASIEVLAGDREAWDRLFDLATRDLRDTENYRALASLVDIPSLIDYMLMVFYVGSRDAPTLLGNDRLPRNFYARRRREPSAPFVFLPWDVEWSLEYEYEDRVSRIGGVQNPALLFQALGRNPAFKRRVADRIHEVFFYDGILTPARSTERYVARGEEIDQAIIGESARWGDARRTSKPYTRNREWLDEFNRLLDSYLPARTEMVLNQLRTEGWYPSPEAPVFRLNNEIQQGGYADSQDKLKMSGSGTVYYTLDGTDPARPLIEPVAGTQASTILGIPLPTLPPFFPSPGKPSTPSGPSDLAASARAYEDSLSLDRSVRVKARAYRNGWSALNETLFAVGPVAEFLRISEIMYHPTDPNAEFLELVNTGPQTLSLDWIRLTEGVHWVGDSLDLKAGHSAVLVHDLAAFERVYGTKITVAGQYDGRLSNAGERLRLEDAAGSPILDFLFSDQWQPRTDGEGYSLVLNDLQTAAGAYGDASSWRVSKRKNGSPGAAD